MADFSPARNAFAVTPNDSAVLPNGPCRGIIVGGAGNVVVVFQDGTQCTFTGLAAGIVHPITANQIKNTNTTATSIVAVY